MRVFSDRSEILLDKKSVVTVGSFDGLHRGHLKILETVKNVSAETNAASFVVTFDPHPRSVLSQF